MKATVFIGTSVDGFIARLDGGIDWLESGEPAPPDEDYGYHAFFATVDALVMGRNTFDLVQTFDSWPYGDKPVIVLTNRPLTFAGNIPTTTVETMAGTPTEVVRRLAERGMTHLYIDGGQTVQAFLREGLVQRLIVSRVPVLIGEGIPLFGPIPKDIQLLHLSTRSYPSGITQTEYSVKPNSGSDAGAASTPALSLEDGSRGDVDKH